MNAMSDEEIDISDIPPLDEESFANAELQFPEGKVPVLLSIDEEITDWFRDKKLILA